MKEENQAIIKALNMYGRVPEQWELLNEIERLNEDNKRLKEDNEYLNKVNIELFTEKNRLNNIINELEDNIVGKINVLYQVRGQSNAIQELSILLRQLRELKGE